MLKASDKIIIIAVLFLVTIFFVGLLIFQYFRGTAKLAQVAENKNIIKQEEIIDLAKLEADYQIESDRIMIDYLAQIEVENADLIQLTEKAQADLLNLSLPAQFKERHLAEVLLLGEIADLAKKEKTALADKKIQELKNFFANQ